MNSGRINRDLGSSPYSETQEACFFMQGVEVVVAVVVKILVVKITDGRTLVATPSFFGAAAFFLVTPVGLAAFTLGAGFATAVAAGFLALGLVVRLIAGAVSMVSKTRGLELPVADRVPSRGILAFNVITKA